MHPWGASLPPSNSANKRLVRELNTVTSEPPKPLEWSNQVITFDLEDHPDNVTGVGTLPLIALSRLVFLNLGMRGG